MITTYSRGKGWLVPALFLGSALWMIPSRSIGVRTCQTMLLVWLILSGSWIAWYGARSLRRASQQLERPLAAYEWIFDLAYLKPRPFHSFMFVQMPWWTFAYGLACYKVVGLLLRRGHA